MVTVKLGDAPERCVNNRRVAKMIRWLLEHQAEIQATERGEIILSYAGDSLRAPPGLSTHAGRLTTTAYRASS